MPVMIEDDSIFKFAQFPNFKFKFKGPSPAAQCQGFRPGCRTGPGPECCRRSVANKHHRIDGKDSRIDRDDRRGRRSDSSRTKVVDLSCHERELDGRGSRSRLSESRWSASPRPIRTPTPTPLTGCLNDISAVLLNMAAQRRRRDGHGNRRNVTVRRTVTAALTNTGPKRRGGDRDGVTQASCYTTVILQAVLGPRPARGRTETSEPESRRRVRVTESAQNTRWRHCRAHSDHDGRGAASALSSSSESTWQLI